MVVAMAPRTDPPTGSIRITDAQTLRVFAHPLRGSLLGVLRLDGPSTASKLAARFGESSGTTSYHLRQLAKYGFVEELPEEVDGRDRWWRALHASTGFEVADLLDDPAGREAVAEIGHRQVGLQQRALAAYAAEMDDLDDEWQKATSLNDWSIRLSPDAAHELAAELNEVLRRWHETRQEPDQPAVSVILDLIRLKEYPL
jgi:DNA-binding transcriptional ArsR family regulator